MDQLFNAELSPKTRPVTLNKIIIFTFLKSGDFINVILSFTLGSSSLYSYHSEQMNLITESKGC